MKTTCKALIFAILVSCFLCHASAESPWRPVEPQPDLEEKIEIIELAVGDLTEIMELSHGEAHLLDPTAEFGYCDDYLNGEEPVWLVTFRDADQTVQYRVLKGSLGETISNARGNEPFQNADQKNTTDPPMLREVGEDVFPQAKDLYNDEGVYFYRWSIEEKAAFSQQWIPFMYSYIQQNPNDPDIEYNLIYQWTRRTWGVPDENALSEEAAFDRAQDAIKALGKEIGSTDYRASFYDVTDPEHPQWRFYFGLRYAVILDAYTGEVLFLRDGSINDYDMTEFMKQR